MKSSRVGGWAICALAIVFGVAAAGRPDDLDAQLSVVLRRAGFTGQIESTLERRLGRPVDPELADLGRSLLFFDKITALHSDNACAGCHSPSRAFSDTQSIAVGRSEQQPRWPEPVRSAQSASHADARQRGVRPRVDVERPFLRSLGRPVRQLRWLHVSASRRNDALYAARSDHRHAAHRAGASAANRAGRIGRLHRNSGNDRSAVRAVRRWPGRCRASSG